MLTPLYPISNTPATITVAAAGALANATSVPVEALEIALPSGFILAFGTVGSGKFAKLTAAADVDDVALATEALPKALSTADTASVPGFDAAVVASPKFTQKDAAEQRALNVLAEQLLELDAPAETGDVAEQLAFAVVLQVNYLLQRGDDPLVKKAITNGAPSLSTTYRDRIINPDAAAIVARVTGKQQVRFTPPLAGV